jgi:excisionase family DNA binding protein
MIKRYCNIKEVSEYTSLSVKILYDWAAQGRIPSIKIGRRVLFDLKDIDQIMENLKRDTAQFEDIPRKIIGGVLNKNAI